MNARVPVVVLSGALGSGKTTLLNGLLRAGRGRAGVIVNDFGAVDVDSLLLSGHVDASASIAGGCLCCLADTSELDDALASLAKLRLDVVIIEASGLAEPRELARMVLASGVRGVRFGGVLEVVDAAAWARAPEALPVAVDHVRVASLVALSKTDLLDDGAPGVGPLVDLVHHVAPEVPVVRAPFGRLDPELLFDASDREEATGQLSIVDLLLEQAPPEVSGGDHHHHDHHHHDHHESVCVVSELGVDPARLVAWLESRPAGVVRVKGVAEIRDGKGSRQVAVQAVGGWFGFEAPGAAGAATTGTRLVAIGTELDAAAVESGLRGCLTDAPASPESLLTLRRYTRRRGRGCRNVATSASTGRPMPAPAPAPARRP